MPRRQLMQAKLGSDELLDWLLLFDTAVDGSDVAVGIDDNDVALRGVTLTGTDVALGVVAVVNADDAPLDPLSSACSTSNALEVTPTTATVDKAAVPINIRVSRRV